LPPLPWQREASMRGRRLYEFLNRRDNHVQQFRLGSLGGFKLTQPARLPLRQRRCAGVTIIERLESCGGNCFQILGEWSCFVQQRGTTEERLKLRVVVTPTPEPVA